MSDQLTPFSMEAEQATLGAVLVNADALMELSFLRPEDFFIVRHGWVFEAMLEVQKRREPVDLLSVSAEMESHQRLASAGGGAYLLELIQKTPSSLNAEGYGHIVERAAVRRRLEAAAQEIARLAHSGDIPIDEAVERAQREVDAVSEKRASAVSNISSAAELALEEIAQVDDWHANPVEVRGMQCGITPLDAAMGGFEAGLYYKVAAPPGMGKSALLAQMADGFATNGTPVLFFSLEMPAREMIRRILCQRARVNSMALRQGKLTPGELMRYKQEAEKVAKLPLWIEWQAGLTVRQMQAIARRYEREHGVRGVFIDTINRIADIQRASSPYQGMTNTSTAIADWAHNSPYFIMDASQLSRAHHNAADKRPRLHDLRDSGSQEQDADGVFMLYREVYYYPDKTDKANLAEVILRKNRYGAANYTVELFWNPTWPGFARLEKTTVELNPPAKPADTLEKAKQKLIRRNGVAPGSDIEEVDGMLLPTGTAR